jgi:hypothetical protein
MMAEESEDFLVAREDFDTENTYTESIAVLEYEDIHRGEKLGAWYLIIQPHVLNPILQIFPLSLVKSFELVESAITITSCIFFCRIVRI